MGLQEEGRRTAGPAALYAWTFGIFALLALWDASGLDVALARLGVHAHRFVLRDDWFVSVVLHNGLRYAAFAVAAWLIGGIWWPTGILRRLDRPARIRWVTGALLAIAAINVLKSASRTSCPWDLAEFGGAASYLSHWAWGLADGGPGRCFPAGHASAGFAFIGGFFAFRSVSTRLAWTCLAMVLAAGFVAGIAQQLRGAHFMSHTLWTAWLCWATALLTDSALRARWRPEPLPSSYEVS